VALENAIDGSSGGHGLETVLPQGVRDGPRRLSLTRLSQGVPPRDDGLFDARWPLRRLSSEASTAGLRPYRIARLVTIFPLVEPTVRAPHPPANVVDGVACEVERHGLSAAVFSVWSHAGLLLGVDFAPWMGHWFSM
jgi:hypothetical protein